MGRVKFAPPRGKGYSNIPNAQMMIAQLEKKLNKEEQDADKHLRDLKQRDNEVEAQLAEVDRNEEANLKQINMDDSIFKTQMGAMQKNVNQEVRNFEAEKAGILNKKSAVDSLIEFAP